jgi:hypothetical protein
MIVEAAAIFMHRNLALIWSHSRRLLGSASPERAAVVDNHAALEQTARPLLQLDTFKVMSTRKPLEVAQAFHLLGPRDDILDLVVAGELGWLGRVQLATLLDC